MASVGARPASGGLGGSGRQLQAPCWALVGVAQAQTNQTRQLDQVESGGVRLGPGRIRRAPVQM